MPTLDFKGKPFVYSYHLSVPFRELKIDVSKSLPSEGGPSLDDNLIIHGDNLHALKALLPKYAGKVDVIYIDPPYNTGKEQWRYNDNVNSPLMKEWLDKEVGLDDLERHDKWLCMMWPRLILLHELLSDKGVIFVSIDDNEMHNLRAVLDHIWGADNFLGQVSVMVNPKGRGMKDSEFAKTHEYLTCYQKTLRAEKIGERKSDEKVDKDYKYRDSKGEKFRTLELRNTHREFGAHNRENLSYPFYCEAVSDEDLGRVSLKPREGYVEVWPTWDDGYAGCWTWDEKKADRDIDLLCTKLVKGQKKKGTKDRLKVFRKSYATDDKGLNVKQKIKTIWRERDFFTETGKSDFLEVMPEGGFETPKPKELIKQILSYFESSELLVLDSFSGSGTLGQAVLEANQTDGESRKFILIETESYADTITAERVRRVMKGVPNAKDETLKKGLGGSFTYCDLGDPIDMDSFFGNSASMPAYDQLASYIAYTATGEALGKAPKTAAKDWFIGEVGGVRLHLIYRADGDFMKSHDAALDMETVKTIAAGNKTGKPSYVFAAAKYMGQTELTRDYDMTFCQLPYAIHRIMGDGVDG